MSTLPRTVIAQPWRQFSHQTAMALQEGGLLQRYLTPIWYAPGRLPYLTLPLLPGALHQGALDQLRKRSFPPLRVELVHTYPLGKAAAYVARRLDRRPAWLERHTHATHRGFDRWVAGQLRTLRPDLFLGYEVAAVESFEACHELGISCVLDLAASHFAFQRTVFDRERSLGRWPVVMSPALLADIEARKAREIELADLILTPSRFARQTLLDAGVDPARVEHIPLGVTLEHFRPKPSYPREGPFRVLFVGTLIARKGLYYLLEAFSRLGVPDAELLIVGGRVPGEGLLERFPGVYRHVSFKHHDELERLYQQADVVVLPSLEDSFGLVILEAMACGTPVIVSEHVGAKELVEDGVHGFVVPAADSEALRDRLRRLYDDRTLAGRLGPRGRAQAERYPVERYRARVREVLQERFGRQRGPRGRVTSGGAAPPPPAPEEDAPPRRVRLNVTPTELQRVSGDLTFYRTLLGVRGQGLRFEPTTVKPHEQWRREVRKLFDRAMDDHLPAALRGRLLHRSRLQFMPDLNGCDAVLSHITLPSRRPHVPLVWSSQGISPERYYEYGQQFRQSDVIRLYSEVGAGCDALLIWHESCAEVVRRECGLRTPVFVVPPIVQRPEVPAYARLPREADVHVLFVGTDARRKGLFDLLEGWSRLGGAAGRAQLDVVSRLSPEDGARAASLPGVRLHATGLDERQLLALMDRADVFALPTHAETIGFALVEAMARGCALLTCDYAPLDEVVTDGLNGFTVAPGDTDALTRALRALVEDRERREGMARAGLERHRTTYSEEAVLPRLRALFDAVCR